MAIQRISSALISHEGSTLYSKLADMEAGLTRMERATLEVPTVPELKPVFISPWASVIGKQKVVFEHNLEKLPSKVEVVFSTDEEYQTYFPLSASLYYDGVALAGVGAVVEVSSNAFTVSTGDYLMLNTLFGEGGEVHSSGFIQVRAWE